MSTLERRICTVLEEFRWGETLAPELRERIERHVKEAGREPAKDDGQLYLQWLRL
ncbi:MAG: hypothetical protein IR164_12045 [Devosia sp.]|uniref:hypothetical protein n=1 Tax=unclassified Devosia TaxID=196773 RepID=UPI0019DDAD1C|nr:MULTISPECIES: hypothetical protein [unclassified Devosia]MBF0679654.1 hypothetical protein [Devosia sp.]WEJ32176.1 hypothetical protein NYQ88_14875 [Devosia sp. SD17-2]